MKKVSFFILLNLFWVGRVLATDLFVDPNVAPGSLPNYFATVNAAINASQSGDRILIAPGIYFENDFTINHSLEIASSNINEPVKLIKHDGGQYPQAISYYAPVQINFNIVQGMVVKLSGLQCCLGSLVGTSGAELSILRCNFKNQNCGFSIPADCFYSINCDSVAMWSMNLWLTKQMAVKFDSIECNNGLYISGSDSSKALFSRVSTGNIILYGAPSMQMEFRDMTANNITCTSYDNSELLCFNVFCSQIQESLAPNTVITSPPRVTLIQCVVGNDIYIYDAVLTMIKSRSNYGQVTFKLGSIISSRAPNVRINDVPGNGGVYDSVNKILIVADTIEYSLINFSDNYPLVIANNYLWNLRISRFNYHPNHLNKIINNSFSAPYPNAQIFVSIPDQLVPYYNIDFSNNVFNSQPYFSGSSGWGVDPNFSYQYPPYFPNRSVPGFFKWSYNGFAIPGSGNLGTLQFVNIPGTADSINAGNPAPEYTDIDLTRNDRGVFGGPYSILNYNPVTNPSNGKAFIYDLDMPANLTPTIQNINIKAKAYHKK